MEVETIEEIGTKERSSSLRGDLIVEMKFFNSARSDKLGKSCKKRGGIGRSQAKREFSPFRDPCYGILWGSKLVPIISLKIAHLSLISRIGAKRRFPNFLSAHQPRGGMTFPETKGFPLIFNLAQPL